MQRSIDPTGGKRLLAGRNPVSGTLEKGQERSTTDIRKEETVENVGLEK